MKLIGVEHIARQEKRTDWILRIFAFNHKNPLYLPIISTLSFFLRVKVISEKKKKKKRSQDFPNPLHKFWDQSSSPHHECCLQVSETVSWHKLRCCYCSNMLQHWIWGDGLIYFWKVDHFRISINFSRNWLGISYLCKIL